MFTFLPQRKCDLYWPESGTEKHGLIEVSLAREDVMATYTVRTFRIRHTRIKTVQQNGKSLSATNPMNNANANVQAERFVYQYQFTTWPDHGVPENPLPLLSFVRRSSDANRDTDAPVVVHCR